MNKATQQLIDYIIKNQSDTILPDNYHGPIRDGSWTFYTDGRIIIRVRERHPGRRYDLVALNNIKSLMPFPGDRYYKKAIELPEAPKPKWEPCEYCNRLGYVVQCPDCEGDGTITLEHGHCVYTVDCDYCGGTGVNPTTGGIPEHIPNEKEKNICPECNGSGKIEKLEFIPIPKTNLKISTKYLRLIKTLTDLVAFKPERIPSFGCWWCLYFKFSDGEGYVSLGSIV